jgi:hypothetical protein
MFLFRAETRLLVLHVPAKSFEAALHIADGLVRRGGPPVVVAAIITQSHSGQLTVDEPWAADDGSITGQYFDSLYARLVHNQPLVNATRPEYRLEEEGMAVVLTLGNGGDDLLQFDRLADDLQRRYRHIYQSARERMSRIQDEITRSGPFLHRSLVERAERAAKQIEEMAEDAAGSGLSQLNYAREIGGAIPVANAAERIESLEAAFANLNFVRTNAEVITALQEGTEQPPRVLNAGFADPAVDRVLEPREALVAGSDYQLLIDIGPRWNRIRSLVTGNDRFPEQALSPSTDGHLIRVVVVSDDFSPHLVEARIWLPARSGRSSPADASGRPDPLPGPIALNLRAPEAPPDGVSTVWTALARLCMYFENNLLQSALVRVGVSRGGAEPAAVVPHEAIARRAYNRFLARGRSHGEEWRDWFEAEAELRARVGAALPEGKVNEVLVDYALTETFRDLQPLARRSLAVGPDGQSMDDLPVAVNITLNDTGTGGHRILINDGSATPTVRVPYDAQGMVSVVEHARGNLQAVFYALNAGVVATDANGKPVPDPNLLASRPRALLDFRADLIRLARYGRDLYAICTGRLRAANGSEWAKTGALLAAKLHAALRDTAVIQAVQLGDDQHVFPWGLVYDYALDPDETNWRMCRIVAEGWPGNNGPGYQATRAGCPHRDEPWHTRDIICPYGFWGLRHVIEQPPSVAAGAAGEPREAAVLVPAGSAALDLAVAVTRDARLDGTLIDAHLARLGGLARLRLQPKTPAVTSNDVRSMLNAPAAVYFLCHGEFDAAQQKPYLGIGPRDQNVAHRVYPTSLSTWATPPPQLDLDAWQTRRPLVIINGCHTCDLLPGHLFNFVTEFTRLGAAGVIGTEVSVLLPVAAEVGALLLDRLTQANPVLTVGQALREVRWELVSRGNLLGLAYTAYCLAGLRVGP